MQTVFDRRQFSHFCWSFLIPIRSRTEVVGAVVVVAVFNGDTNAFSEGDGVEHVEAIDGPLAFPLFVAVVVK